MEKKNTIDKRELSTFGFVFCKQPKTGAPEKRNLKAQDLPCV
jgi:hypothetical protein